LEYPFDAGRSINKIDRDLDGKLGYNYNMQYDKT
jgi:hypothetical protein